MMSDLDTVSEECSKSHLSILYIQHNKGTSNAGIPLLLISYLSSAYCELTSFIYSPMCSNYLFYIGVRMGC